MGLGALTFKKGVNALSSAVDAGPGPYPIPLDEPAIDSETYIPSFEVVNEYER